MRAVLWSIFAGIVCIGNVSAQQQKLVKVLVTTPFVAEKSYRAVGDVFAGSIIRELNRNGGIELVDREKSERWLLEHNRSAGVNNREIAGEVAKALGADIVIYSTLMRTYDTFAYDIALLEVDRDVIQRILSGAFKESTSASEIGRVIRTEMKKIVQYIPLPSELSNPGVALRQEVVNPDNLPKSLRIDLPRLDQYGTLEQVFTYWRVFPGEVEYQKLEVNQQLTRVQFDRDEMDAELYQTLSRLQMYGEFSLRYNLQAYLIKNCSIRAVNVLIANKIPVFYSDDGKTVSLLSGYSRLRDDGYCVFHTNFNDNFESYDLIHRKLICILIILPRPGKKGGISRDYIETAISRYPNDWGKNPSLVEIKEGFLDIISSGVEN